MMSAPIPSPDGAVENDRHHHHDRHPVEMAGEAVIVDDVSGEPSPTPDADPIAVIEAALVRLVDDVGVLAEEDVVRAFSILKATDLPSYLRLRHAAKKANRECSVTMLDKLVRAELPASDDDASALDELVTVCRPSCVWMCEGGLHGNPAFAPTPAGSLRAAVATYRTGARWSGAPAHPAAGIATGSARHHHAR